MKRWLIFLMWTVLVAALAVLGSLRFGKTPAMGVLLSPTQGFWQNAERGDMPQQQTLDLPGLKAPVTVYFDDRMVPHIYALNEHDLYYTQGYIQAKFRLFQMEMMTYAAAGRVAEILGPGQDSIYLHHDRYRRRMGMLESARQAVETFQKDTVARNTVEAYAAGINAYIDQLSPNQFPIEYKLLGIAPEPWTSVKTALVLKFMAYDLTGATYDNFLTQALRIYGRDTTEFIYPNRPRRQDPTIPPGTPWDFTPLPIRKPTDGYLADTGQALGGLAAGLSWLDRPDGTQNPDARIADVKGSGFQPEPDLGSNNWAVGGDRSATGFPILANDPHLGLKLPSIWFEFQLVAPGVNVYGVSIPGAPCVIIGFNERVAWGVTNVGADVLDWYRVEFRDEARAEYRYEGQWRKLARVQLDTIQIRGQADVIDTLRYTHHGPIMYHPGDKPFQAAIPVGYALRWVAHEPSNELMTFYHLNRASSYTDYEKALTFYDCPAQNFAFASLDKDIALWVNGKYPLKWPGQGKYLLDGSAASHDWQGWVPRSHNPHIKNPARGFISSANQWPTDSTYPYFLDWHFEPFERGERINQVLNLVQRATHDSLRALQNDNHNLLAEWTLPRMLSLVNVGSLKGAAPSALEAVKSWHLRNDADAVGASIFYVWWEMLERLTWEDDFGGKALMYPRRDRLAEMLMTDSTARWWDNRLTPERETIKQIVTAALQAAADTLATRTGQTDPTNQAWQWARWKATHIDHMLSIPAFGHDSLFIGGGRGIVNATRESNGPSWRMVVEVGPKVQGWGIYPGGQSGNPGSPWYDDRIAPWTRGELHPLLFLPAQNPASTPGIISTMTISPS